MAEPQWEYRIVEEADDEQFTRLLTEASRDEWEAVGFTRVSTYPDGSVCCALLKRRLWRDGNRPRRPGFVDESHRDEGGAR